MEAPTGLWESCLTPIAGRRKTLRNSEIRMDKYLPHSGLGTSDAGLGLVPWGGE